MQFFTEFKTSANIDLNKLIKKTIYKAVVKKELIEYNQDQLQDGIDSDGKRIYTIAAIEQELGHVYSMFTRAEKAGKNQDYRNVTLHDTGKFYKSMKVKLFDDSFEIIGNFEKEDGNIYDNFEEGKYDFLGITDENLESFIWYDFLEYFMEFFALELEK